MNADVSVRLAWPDDAAAIAAVQGRHWQSVSGAQVDTSALRDSWAGVLTAPPDARVRALVALEAATVRGLCLVHPCADPDADPVADGEVAELVVDTDHRRVGHGSRLLQAAADTLRADGFTRAVAWLTAVDDDARRFLTDAGWAPDGAHRELEGEDGARLKQVRLHTDLGDG